MNDAAVEAAYRTLDKWIPQTLTEILNQQQYKSLKCALSKSDIQLIKPVHVTETVNFSCTLLQGQTATDIIQSHSELTVHSGKVSPFCLRYERTQSTFIPELFLSESKQRESCPGANDCPQDQLPVIGQTIWGAFIQTIEFSEWECVFK